MLSLGSRSGGGQTVQVVEVCDTGKGRRDNQEKGIETETEILEKNIRSKTPTVRRVLTEIREHFIPETVDPATNTISVKCESFTSNDLCMS